MVHTVLFSYLVILFSVWAKIGEVIIGRTKIVVVLIIGSFVWAFALLFFLGTGPLSDGEMQTAAWVVAALSSLVTWRLHRILPGEIEKSLGNTS
jgi:hypothetical protein